MKLKKAGLVVLWTVGLLGCGTSDENIGGTEQGVAPGGFDPDYASSPAFFTRMKSRVDGGSPHGSVRIWYSTNIESIIDDASFVVPAGTTAIKEFDGDGDGTLDGYAVMVKEESGYDPANGDWYYEMRDASGTVMDEPAPGKIEGCIDCHTAAKRTDYLAGTFFE